MNLRVLSASAAISITFLAGYSHAAATVPAQNNCADLVAQYRAIRQFETESRIQLARATQPGSDLSDVQNHEAYTTSTIIATMNHSTVAVQLDELEGKLAQHCSVPMLTRDDAKQYYSKLKKAGVRGLQRWQELED